MPEAQPSPAPRSQAAPGLAPGADALQTLRNRLAARLGLEPASITPELRMLSDLHLSSISVAQIVGEAARAVGNEAPPHAAELANATVAEAAQAIRDSRGGRAGARSTLVTGVENWVRAFEFEHRALPEPHGATPATPPVAAAPEHILILRIPRDPTPEDAARLLRAAHAALQLPAGGALGIVQERPAAGAFARSLALERPDLRVCVVTAPGADESRLHQEIQRAPFGYQEVTVDAAGARTSPTLVAIPGGRLATRGGEPILSADDVILASGGAGGIGGECALRLARRSGAALALLGRSPADDPAVVAQLERMHGHGVRARYYQADICDAAAVARAVALCDDELGTVTAVLHAAGVHEPRALAAIDEELLGRTLAVEVTGLASLLAAVDASGLRALVTLSSIIQRTGMQGEAHHALAHEWLTAATEDFSRGHPSCRCLAIEWSVWSGLGMGMTLGTREGLERRGITPISVDRGLEWLERLLATPADDVPVAVVVTGRLGQPPPLQMDRPQLPLTRFVEATRAHTPGVELICDARLSHERDPYLAEHSLHGDAILPAVIALEAMAQVARALTGGDRRISGMREIRFAHPVIVPEGPEVTLRVACLQDDTGDVRVVVRSSTTDFAVDHVLGTVELATPRYVGDVATATLVRWDETRRDLPLDPAYQLYGRIFFQGGRFQRVAAYHRLEAQGCDVRLDAARSGAGTRWFGGTLSNELVLGDPGARDALLHALQACVPHRRVLPVAVERIQLATLDPGGSHRVEADEISCENDRHVFDAIMLDGAGHIVEKWLGLELQAIEPLLDSQVWPLDLVGAYLERRVRELAPDSCARFAIGRGGSRDDARRQAVRSLMGRDMSVSHRPDGKPEIAGGEISFSHAPQICLAAFAPHEVACDLETARDPQGGWRDLLGDDAMLLAQRLAGLGADTLEVAATRVWGAREALRKAGELTASTPTLDEVAGESWLVLSGRDADCTLLSWAGRVEGFERPIVFTLLLSPQQSRHATEPSAPPAPPHP